MLLPSQLLICLTKLESLTAKMIHSLKVNEILGSCILILPSKIIAQVPAGDIKQTYSHENQPFSLKNDATGRQALSFPFMAKNPSFSDVGAIYIYTFAAFFCCFFWRGVFCENLRDQNKKHHTKSLRLPD